MNFLRTYKRECLAIPALIILIFGVFGQVRNFDFLIHDDPIYIYENPHIRHGLSLEGIRWALSADLLKNSIDADYWRPLTFISHMLDAEFYGLNASGHHLTNLWLHILNCLILFLFLNYATTQFEMSFLIAALFAIHPLQVQTVAWVTARKDLLSAFFGLLTLWLYTLKIKNPSQSKFALTTWLFFGLCLATKPALIVLPVILIAFDLWVFNRSGKVNLISEKIPLFALSLVSLLILISNKSSASIDVPNYLQYLNIPFNLKEYLLHFIYPVNLSIYSPVAYETFSILKIFSVLLGALIFLIWAWVRRRADPLWLFGSIWFLVLIAPSIVLTRADRFMYFPIIGLLIIFVSWLVRLREKLQLPRFLFIIISSGLILGLSFISFMQTKKWKDSITLFSDVLHKDPKHHRAHYILGIALSEKGEMSEAVSHYLKSLDGSKKDSGVYNSIGLLMLKQENDRKAIYYFMKATQAYPDPSVESISYNNIGLSLKHSGNLKLARVYFKKALRQNSQYAEPYYNLGQLAFEYGNVERAIKYLEKAIGVFPHYELARKELGVLFAQIGMPEKAIEQFESILKFNPRSLEANNNLGGVLLSFGKVEDAKRHFKTALKYNPDYEPARKNLEIIQKKWPAI